MAKPKSQYKKKTAAQVRAARSAAAKMRTRDEFGQFADEASRKKRKSGKPAAVKARSKSLYKPGKKTKSPSRKVKSRTVPVRVGKAEKIVVTDVVLTAKVKRQGRKKRRD